MSTQPPSQEDYDTHFQIASFFLKIKKNFLGSKPAEKRGIAKFARKSATAPLVVMLVVWPVSPKTLKRNIKRIIYES